MKPASPWQLFDKLMKALQFAIVFLVISGGCAIIPDGDDVGPDRVSENYKNLKAVEIGWEKSMVRTAMGDPQKIFLSPRNAAHLDFWKYQTSGRALTDWALSDVNYTTLVFENDILIGICSTQQLPAFIYSHPPSKRLKGDGMVAEPPTGRGTK